MEERRLMQIKILRSETNTHQLYTLPAGEIPLLNALTYIKETQDATLTFSAGCRASVCGTCAVRVNGREELSCSYKVKPGDVIEPLQYHPSCTA
jgi:fumarate reductase iron-sulfur subunit